LIKNSVVDVLGDFWLGQLGRMGRVGDCPVDTGIGFVKTSSKNAKI
jgi:hypothetical protein